MKVFLTGAAGFVGSRLSKALLARGDTVIGSTISTTITRPPEGKTSGGYSRSQTLHLHQGDLRDSELLRKLMAEHKPDAIAHLAAMARCVQHGASADLWRSERAGIA